MYYYRKLKVKKDKNTDIYVYHLDDDFEFHDLDKRGLLYNKMRVTLLGSSDLMVETWSDQIRYDLFEKYRKSAKYHEYLQANVHTRYAVEEIVKRDIDDEMAETLCRFYTKDCLIDRHIHAIDNALFSSTPNLIDNCTDLIFITEIGPGPSWSHVIKIPETLKYLNEKKLSFIELCKNYFKLNKLDVDVT